MVAIGISAPENISHIERIFKAMFAAYGKKGAIIKLSENMHETISQLDKAKIDFAVFPAKPDCLKNIFLDILIYDNKANEVSFDILKCITPKTMLISNGDFAAPHIPHKITAINYGLSGTSTVTASSINSYETGLEFVYCLQRGIKTLSGSRIEIKEFSVNINMANINVYHALPVITSAILSDIKPNGKIEI
ncbi:MAG: hypothetical protein N2171_08150 [Clostridia bacterium]|nr:hypothetical protein [Clostridia bacterium]